MVKNAFSAVLQKWSATVCEAENNCIDARPARDGFWVVVVETNPKL